MGVKLLLLFTLAVATAKFIKRNNLKKRSLTAYIHNVSSVPTYIHIELVLLFGMMCLKYIQYMLKNLLEQ